MPHVFSPKKYVGQAEQDGWLGFTSFLSLVAFGLLLKVFSEHDLMRGKLGYLLLAFTSTFALFNLVCLWIWVDPYLFSTSSCRWFAYLQLFSLNASPLYFGMLVLYLRSLARNPFHVGHTRYMHCFAILTAGTIAVVEYRSGDVTEVLTAAFEHTSPCTLASEASRCVSCPHVFLYTWTTYKLCRVLYCIGVVAVMLVFAWDLNFALGKQADVFSERKKLVLKGLGWFMFLSATYHIAIPSVVILIKDGFRSNRGCIIAECIAQGSGTAVQALVWLRVTRHYAERFQRASDEDTGELAAGLREQVVRFIKQGMVASAENCHSHGMDIEEVYSMSFTTASSRTVAVHVMEFVAAHMPVVFHRILESFGVHRTGTDFVARAPGMFHRIRERSGIPTSAFVASVQQSVRENLTEGKSGAFMYFTADDRFMIKTATKEEFDLLFDILPRYMDHIENNPQTLINPILGAYELQLYNEHLRVIVVESVFWLGVEGQATFKPNERFDLKGSWVGRHFKVPSKVGLPYLKPQGARGCMKDMDIHAPLRLHQQEASRLSKQLHADSAFLADCNIMDYSLLLGVQRQPLRVLEECGVVRAGLKHQSVALMEGPTDYCFGIIDVLQAFSSRKKLEYIWLAFLRCKGPGVSCVPPAAYAKRFQDNVAKGLIEGKLEEDAPVTRPARYMVASRRGALEPLFARSRSLH